MDDDRRRTIEARRVINLLSRVCRQTVTFLDGKSCLDASRMKRVLRDAIAASDRFTGSG